MGYYGYYYGFDWTYGLVLIAAVLSMLASAKVNSVFFKYKRVPAACGLTGAQVAERILQQSGIYNVGIEAVDGKLTDHYDPRAQVVRLSNSTFDSTSVAAISVAAHECGHAIQHDEGYVPLTLRSLVFPVASFGSRYGIYIVLFGLLFAGNNVLVDIGIWLFSASVLFQIVTLPVEFNASARALAKVEQYGILGSDERKQAKEILFAAALTYVASAAASVFQLLRLLLLRGKRRDD